MNDDELKALWQQQTLRNPPSAALLISAMQKQTNQLRRCLDARDIRELVACAVVIVIFGIFYAVAALITWRVYLAVPRDRDAERETDRVSATLAS